MLNDEFYHIGTTAEIERTKETPLFQTKRENLTAYRIDAPVGEYAIEMDFADLYNAPANAAYDLQKDQDNTEGVNSFDIYINDSLVLKKYSPYLLQGNNVALTQKINFYNSTGNISVSFRNIKGKCFLNNLWIKQQ